jgi:hypothetical protein
MIYTLEETNRRLKKFYGSDDSDRAKFRLVFSTGMTEKVRGEDGAVSLQPKYAHSSYKDRWILEVCTTVPNNETSELSDFYEPLWVFQDRQIATYKALEFLIWCYRNPEKKPPITQEELRDRSIRETFMMLFGNSEGDHRFIEGSALLLPGKDF